MRVWAKGLGYLQACGLLALCGCGVKTSTSIAVPTTSAEVGVIHGSVHGGQQPLAYSHIYVFAVGTGGYGTGSSPLLIPTPGTITPPAYVVADQTGSFQLAGQYLCTPGTQVYLYASGGDPGLGSGSNSAIGLLAVLGQCPTIGTLAAQVPSVAINEVSTVVAAYALAGFAADGSHIASANTSLAATGVANAVSTALNIINVPSGLIPPVSATGNAILPVAKINTLANILASCVNSPGPASSSCQTLLSNTGGSSDTAAAAIAMAHAPFSSIGTLFGLASTSAPFQPSLGSPPTDLTLSLQYLTTLYQQNLAATNDAYQTVWSSAIDSSGNVWLYATNDPQSANAQTFATFVKYSPTGQLLVNTAIPASSSANAFLSTFVQIAIDSSNHVWAGALGGEYELSSQGTLLSPATGYPCGPDGISTVFGSGNQVYVGQLNHAVSVLSSTGTCLGEVVNSYLSGPLGADPQGFALAAAYNSLSPSSPGNILELSGTSSSIDFAASPTQWTSADAAGNVWTYAYAYTQPTRTSYTYGDVLIKYSATGSLLSPTSGYTGGGLTPPPTGAQPAIPAQGGAPQLDGAGAVWLTSLAGTFSGSTSVQPIIALKSDGTPITPASGLICPVPNISLAGVSLDGSGNLWAPANDGSIVEFIGLTTPVATPILYNQLGQTP